MRHLAGSNLKRINARLAQNELGPKWRSNGNFGNIEGLPNRFVYRDTTERSVHVASQGIVEALRSVYGAQRLLVELGVSGK